MKKIDVLAEDMGIHVVHCWGWPKAGAVYSTDLNRALIHVDVTMGPKRYRWAMGHEIGHDWWVGRLADLDRSLAEAKSNRLAVKILLELYDIDQVAWPKRIWHLLPHWEDLEYREESPAETQRAITAFSSTTTTVSPSAGYGSTMPRNTFAFSTQKRTR